MLKIMGPKRRKREEALKKRRKKKALAKKWSARVLILSFFIGVLGGICYGVKFGLDKIFYIRNITVVGNSHYDDDEIIKSGGISMGDNILFANTKKSENKIYSEFPYVEKISISKKLPGSLEFVVETGSPCYFLDSENEYLIVSFADKLLEKSAEYPPEIIHIKGLEFSVSENGKVIYKNQEIKESVFKIINAFKSNELNSLSEIDISDVNDIKVEYDHRIHILMGSEEDFSYKLLTAKEIIMNKISAFEKGTLNLKSLKKENRSYFTSE